MNKLKSKRSKKNYNKNICDLECFKYDYLCNNALEGNATLTVKSEDKIKTYFTKHIFNPFIKSPIKLIEP